MKASLSHNTNPELYNPVDAELQYSFYVILRTTEYLYAPIFISIE